ncbi:NDMA-dependent methanol dehydrogenase [Tsukamurella tyrosinosolvens]|uniref:NDMA-dependent methanol dehydrogenase n=4 Tax=Tsukamurella TaxID=2060 RepID=A0A5C5RWX0_9ACTN|nr:MULTISPECIES: NDMA-dependent methanol dehydrogenase [Tsukamurella]AUN41659.1 NDMA-dependent methanol dehydrogenase [Tsukamurella tyrosinosolvens]KXO90853.1 NDMA-dependent methanol dehydrogenase [Tsukamurella tyrosinosolvens]KXP07045.1 NDMA-dependent methanol dehydrogenase [Tsukamurella tyrosinosolvens]KZL98246.1 NDMA-dependent methanol dehydrogenase [Tsukamurella tyrosinosolvens]MCA4994401.1 NDMA-dependent methanol dehydrogenase [Tsukamurella tyrosinosolvens]
MAIELNQIWDFPIKEFHPFPRALMGVGAHDIIGVEAKNLGFKRALLVTTGLRGSGIIEELIGKIEYQGVEVVLFDKVESNPKDYNVMEAAAMYEKEKCDSIISVGGGSSHDAAKGARVVIAHDGRNINEFEGFAKSTNKKNPPHIAVSTTAGTGSETSWAYVITDTSDMDKPHKWVAFDEASIVTLAIDDPLLYYSCPQHFTAYCGFDVLAHGSEPYVSRLDFAPSLGNALYSIELVAKNLREATFEPRNLKAREGMMNAQYISAQAFNSGGLGIVHSISHAVSAFFDSHHGLNNAIALPRVWEYNLPSRYERYAEIAVAMGVDTRNMTTVQAADAAVEAAIRLAKDVGIPDNFGQIRTDSYDKNQMNSGKYAGRGEVIKGDEKSVLAISEHIQDDWCTPGNPREVTVSSMIPVVDHCINGTY